MSAVWDAHYKRISDLIAANPVQRAPMAAPPSPMTVQPGIQAMLPPGLLDMGSGGGDGGMTGVAAGPGGSLGSLGGMFGGINPGTLGGWGGGLVGGLLGGPFGALAGSVGGRALAGLLDSPSAPQAMAQETVGPYGGFGIEVAAPGYGGGMAGEAGSAGFGGGTATEGSTGEFGGAMGEIGFQMGGYTGAGRDGVVQPSRRAGVVHEGEYVIPAHLVKRMGLLAK
jgi:hypothetical protein